MQSAEVSSTVEVDPVQPPAEKQLVSVVIDIATVF